MKLFTKPSDTWLCQLNNVSLTLEQKFYVLVNAFNAKWEEQHAEIEKLRNENIKRVEEIEQLSTQISQLKSRVDLMENNAGTLQTYGTIDETQITSKLYVSGV